MSILTILIGSAILIASEPAGATFWANSHHTPFLDYFFKYFTQIAEWPVIVAALLLAFYRNIRTGFIAGLIYLAESAVVNGTKAMLHTRRPVSELSTKLHHIDGVNILSHQSFPSGHTAAAFVGFGIISMLYPNRWIQLFCGLSAVLVGYSRLYLGQHYLRDVMASAFIALLLLYLFQYLTTKFSRN